MVMARRAGPVTSAPVRDRMAAGVVWASRTGPVTVSVVSACSVPPTTPTRSVCSPGELSRGMVTTRLKAPPASVMVVPRRTGSLNSSACNVVMGGNPPPVTVTASPGAACWGLTWTNGATSWPGPTGATVEVVVEEDPAAVVLVLVGVVDVVVVATVVVVVVDEVEVEVVVDDVEVEVVAGGVVDDVVDWITVLVVDEPGVVELVVELLVELVVELVVELLVVPVGGMEVDVVVDDVVLEVEVVDDDVVLVGPVVVVDGGSVLVVVVLVGTVVVDVVVVDMPMPVIVTEFEGSHCVVKELLLASPL